MLTIELPVEGEGVVSLTTGDVLDLGEYGIIKWFSKAEADTFRMLTEAIRARLAETEGQT